MKQRWLVNWMNQDIDVDDEFYHRSKILRGFLKFGLGVFIILTILNILVGPTHSQILSGLGMVSFLIIWFYFNKTKKFTVSAFSMIFSSLGLIFYHLLHSESFMMSHMIWAPVFPLLGSLLLKRKHGHIVFVATLFVFLGTSLWVHFMGPIELVRTSSDNRIFDMIGVFLCLSTTYLLISFHEKIQEEVHGLLETKQNQLQEIADDHQALSAVVAHDLANPIMTTEIYLSKLESLCNKSFPMSAEDMANTHHYLQKVIRGHRRTIDLIRHVRELIQLLHSKIQISLVPTDLFSVLEAVLEDFEEKIQEKNLLISVHRSKDHDMWCLANPEGLRNTVLSNLISNAIKFSPTGSMIDIVLFQEDQKIHMELRDYGAGIEVEKPLFDSVQSPSVGTLGEKGLGYGLFITKSIIKRFKGNLEIINMNRIESKNTGTLIKLSLNRA